MGRAWERIKAEREDHRRAHLRMVKIVGLIGWLLFWGTFIAWQVFDV